MYIASKQRYFARCVYCKGVGKESCLGQVLPLLPADTLQCSTCNDSIIIKEDIFMPTIHANTDVMRQLAQAYLNWNNTLQSQMLPQLQNLTAQLEGDWIGVSRQDYDGLLQNWQQSLNSLISAGQNLGNHVLNTANQFESADHS